PLRDAERQPGLGLAAHLLPQHTMMDLQIQIRIFKLQVNENAVLARLVHLRRFNEWCARQLHRRFQTADMGSITHAFVHSGVYMACSRVVCSMMPARM